MSEKRVPGSSRFTALKLLAFAALAVALSQSAPAASAQVGISIGVAPVCPYGYFDYAPYDCAPYGYYGPDWFVGGLFIGAGPWFHGPRGFYGHVDNRYDPHYGYHGPLPERGAEPFNHFHGNEARDGRGHIGSGGHDGGHERAARISRRQPRWGAASPVREIERVAVLPSFRQKKGERMRHGCFCGRALSRVGSLWLFEW